MGKKKTPDIVVADTDTGEVVSSELSVMPKFKIVKSVSKRLVKLKPGEPVYVKLTSKFYTGETLSESKIKTPPQMIDCEHITPDGVRTGCYMIAGAVLKNTIEKEYGDPNYIGRIFCIEKIKIEGKNYSNFQIDEVEYDA